MRLYKYLYYRLYSWNLKQWGKRDDPQWNALLGVSFMMFINLISISLVLELLGYDVFLIESLPKIGIVTIALLILFFNYFLYVHKGKFKIIGKEFSKESKKNKRINALLLWIYVISSFLLNFGILYLIKNGYTFK